MGKKRKRMTVTDVESRPRDEVVETMASGRVSILIGDNDGMVFAGLESINAGDPVYLNPDGTLVGIAVSDEDVNSDGQAYIEVSLAELAIPNPIEEAEIEVRENADGRHYIAGFYATETVGRARYNPEALRNLRFSTPGQ